jgi:hypothetical protein
MRRCMGCSGYCLRILFGWCVKEREGEIKKRGGVQRRSGVVYIKNVYF